MKRYEPFNEKSGAWEMSGAGFENEDDAIEYSIKNGYAFIYDNVSDTWKRVEDIQTNF